MSTLNDHNLLRPVHTELYLTYLCRQTSPHTTPDLYLRQSFNLICLQRCSNLLPIKSRAWQGHVNMCSDVTPAETSQSHARQSDRIQCGPALRSGIYGFRVCWRGQAAHQRGIPRLGVQQLEGEVCDAQLHLPLSLALHARSEARSRKALPIPISTDTDDKVVLQA